MTTQPAPPSALRYNHHRSNHKRVPKMSAIVGAVEHRGGADEREPEHERTSAGPAHARCRIEGEAETVVGSYSNQWGPLEDYCIPDYILKLGSNKYLVFDLLEEAPDEVMHRFYANLERRKMEGDILAVLIWMTLMLIASHGRTTG